MILPRNLTITFSAQSEINLMLIDFRIIEGRTCIRFVERTFEIDFVEIINGDGCWSWLGRQGGRQELSMCRSCGCVQTGIALHEAIHALGYDHMHNHIDRDDFVRVFWENNGKTMLLTKLILSGSTTMELLTIFYLRCTTQDGRSRSMASTRLFRTTAATSTALASID